MVAAGRSTRLGTLLPKPFLLAARRPLLAWSLAAFERARAIAGVVVVAPVEHIARARRIARPFRKVLAVVQGGERRQDSVAAGVRALPLRLDPVLVHDAARPLVEPELIDAVARAAARGAAIAASPVPDTLKRARNGQVVETIDRRELWRAETPQGARRAWLEAALAATDDASDEALMLERAGRRVDLVASGSANLKVTTPGDLELVRALLAARRRR